MRPVEGGRINDRFYRKPHPLTFGPVFTGLAIVLVEMVIADVCCIR
jgi:hypothetical protein